MHDQSMVNLHWQTFMTPYQCQQSFQVRTTSSTLRLTRSIQGRQCGHLLTDSSFYSEGIPNSPLDPPSDRPANRRMEDTPGSFEGTRLCLSSWAEVD